MTTQTKKAGRKPNAEKAAEAAALAKPQELAKIEVIDGEKVVTDLEPVAKAPVTLSVDVDGEDLGDVSNAPVQTPVIEAPELVETFSSEVQGTRGTEVTELPTPETDFETILQQEIDSAAVAELIARAEAFKPILVPTMVGDERKGHIPCPKAVFELVQIEGWQDSIDEQPAHVAAGLKSVQYWQDINGTVKVRCQSSSRFAEAK